MKSIVIGAAASAGLFLSACAYAGSAGPEPASVAKTGLGEVLADGAGMTLYTFAKDTPAVSNCYGKCAELWPPLMAAADAQPQGLYGVIARKDGSRQWAYQGMPLYGWVKDKQPGDTSGDGVKGVWSVARP